jgi:hypothetical protein
MLKQARHYQLHMILKMLYRAYREGTLTKAAYLESVKPIDDAIDKLEMAILKDSLVLQESFSQHTLKPKC